MSGESVFQARIGGVTIDVARSAGYFGGVALAVGLGMIEPPLALFIAALPAIKVLTHRSLPLGLRVVGDVLVGVAKPVGGDGDAVVRLGDQQLDDAEAVETAQKAERGQEILQRRPHAVSQPAS